MRAPSASEHVCRCTNAIFNCSLFWQEWFREHACSDCEQLHDRHTGKCTRFWFLSHQWAAKTYTSLEPRHEISNIVVCATSKGSDQPAHTRSLIRAFVCRLNKVLTEHHLEFLSLKEAAEARLSLFMSKRHIVQLEISCRLISYVASVFAARIPKLCRGRPRPKSYVSMSVY